MRIGRDVTDKKLVLTPPVHPSYKRRDYKTKIIELLKKSPKPLNIDEVRRAVGCNRNTARSILWELVLEGEADFFRSNMAHIFKLKRTSEVKE